MVSCAFINPSWWACMLSSMMTAESGATNISLSAVCSASLTRLPPIQAVRSRVKKIKEI